MNPLQLAWELLRVEGPRAVVDRLRDRLRFWQWEREARLVGALDASNWRALPGGLLPVHAVLNVSPGAPRPDWGGVQQQLLRRLEAEAKLRPVALLYGAADGYRLLSWVNGERRAVELRQQQRLPGFSHQGREPRFEKIVEQAAQLAGAGGLHFEQLVGLPLASIAALAERMPVVISVHDYGLFCRRPHLIERPSGRFCEFSTDAERCRRCLEIDWNLPADAQTERRKVSVRVLQGARAVVFPSADLLSRHLELFPGIGDQHFHIIAPAAFRRPTSSSRPAGPRRTQHVAFVGSVQIHKGALLFEQLVRQLGVGGSVDRWSVYGGGDLGLLRRLRALPGVRVRGYYAEGSLPELLRADRVDLALLLSIWPESYALSLDECAAAGVPVLAFDHGAPAERIRGGGAGFLVPPSAGASGLADAIRGIGETPSPGASRVELSDASHAAAEHLELYRDLRLCSPR